MDPLSVAASVAGLLSLTVQVSQILYEQVNAMKNAPKDAKGLTQELEGLCQVLTSLEQILNSQSSKGRSFTESSVLVNAIRGCKTQVTTMKLKIEKISGTKGLSQFLERGKWFYERDEHQELMQTLHRYLGMFQISLTVDGLEMLSKSIDDATEEARAKTQQLNDISQLLSPLASMSKEISDVTNTFQQWNSKWLDQESRDIITWLSPLNFWAKQDDTLFRREEGTCQWIFEEFTFKKWLEGSERILWCPGMPGAGKTILAATVIDQLQRRFSQDDVGVAFVYCNYKEKGEQTLVNLISSLLQQLFLKRRTLPIRVRTLYEQHNAKRTTPTLAECLELLHVELTSYSKTLIVVDALDECDDINGTRNDFITELLRLPTCTSLMVTSRPLPSIEAQLKQTCRLEIRASDADMRIYVIRQMERKDRLKRHVDRDPTLKQAILEKLVKNAQGMFLLAQLHMDSLTQKHKPKDIRVALENLPEKLDETYDEAMMRIQSQNKEDIELARRVLSWISFAVRPMTVREMRHAIAVEPGQIMIEEDDLIDEEILISVCAGLVVIDQEGEVIRLIHYTTQEYFDRNRLKVFPNGEFDIATTCLTYLSFDEFRSGYCEDDAQMEARLQRNPFLEYAAQNWGIHAHGDVERTLENQILEFLAQEPLLSSMTQASQLLSFRFKGFSQHPPKTVHGLLVAADFDLVATVTTLLERDIDLGVKTDHGETALHRAASQGHKVVVQLLLDKGASIEARDHSNRSALQTATFSGHKSVVQLLLDNGADTEAKDHSNRTALHTATFSGHKSIVQLLLDNGADTEAKDHSDRTALHEAILKGHESVVQLLLEKGADIRAKDKYGWTALNLTTFKKHSLVQLLLENGANIEDRNIHGQTALHQAASEGDGSMVQLLIEKGADIEAKNNRGETVLHGAALEENGYSVVQLLLEKGADIEAKDNHGWTTLHRAAFHGKSSVIQLLLEIGANIEAKNNYGDTALHEATIEDEGSVAQVLLDKGANIEAQDNQGRTALYVAASRGKINMVRLFLENGADGSLLQQAEEEWRMTL